MTHEDLKLSIQCEATIEEVIPILKKSGYNMTASMKYLVQNYSVGLGEAKKLVASSPCWKDHAEASHKLQNEIVSTVNNSKDKE